MFSAELVDSPALEQEAPPVGSKARVCGAEYLGEALPVLRTSKPKCQLVPKNLQQFRAICQQYVYKNQETKKLSVCLLVVRIKSLWLAILL